LEFSASVGLIHKESVTTHDHTISQFRKFKIPKLNVQISYGQQKRTPTIQVAIFSVRIQHSSRLRKYDNSDPFRIEVCLQ